MYNRIPLDTQVAEQRSPRSAEAENSILHHRLAAAHRVEEVVEVIVAVAVSRRSRIGILTERRQPSSMLLRILLLVILEKPRLHGLGIRSDRQSRPLFTRRPGNDDRVVLDLQ